MSNLFEDVHCLKTTENSQLLLTAMELYEKSVIVFLSRGMVLPFSTKTVFMTLPPMIPSERSSMKDDWAFLETPLSGEMIYSFSLRKAFSSTTPYPKMLKMSTLNRMIEFSSGSMKLVSMVLDNPL